MDVFWAEQTTAESGRLSTAVLTMLTGVARQSFTRLLPPLCPNLGGALLRSSGALGDDERELVLLRSDPMLAGQALAAANIMQSGGDLVTELPDAMERLGQGACSALLQASAASAMPLPAPFEEPAERLAAHSVCVAGLARRLARATGMSPETAFAAGLIHDVGRALVLHGLARLVRLPEVAAELELSGVERYLDHPVADRLGGELVRCWALPPVMRDSVGVSTDCPPRRGIAALVARAEVMVRGGVNDHRLAIEQGAVGGSLGGMMVALTPRAAVA